MDVKEKIDSFLTVLQSEIQKHRDEILVRQGAVQILENLKKELEPPVEKEESPVVP